MITENTHVEYNSAVKEEREDTVKPLNGCVILQTADKNWNPSLLDENARLFFKVRDDGTLFISTDYSDFMFFIPLHGPYMHIWSHAT